MTQNAILLRPMAWSRMLTATVCAASLAAPAVAGQGQAIQHSDRTRPPQAVNDVRPLVDAMNLRGMFRNGGWNPITNTGAYQLQAFFGPGGHLRQYRVVVGVSVVSIDDYTTAGDHLRPGERIVSVDSGGPVASVWFIVPFGLNNKGGGKGAGTAAAQGTAPNTNPRVRPFRPRQPTSPHR